MKATFVDRIQLQDDKAELWAQPLVEERALAIEIGMRFRAGATSVSLSVSPLEATVLAHRLIHMARQAQHGCTVACDEQFPDF